MKEKEFIGLFEEFIRTYFYEHPHESNFICSESFVDMEEVCNRFKEFIEENK